MMDINVLKTTLDSTGLPVAYHHWAVGQVPKLPYILYYEKSDNNFNADNHSYYSDSSNIVIELYSNTKNKLEESKLEKLLDENQLFFSWYESYLDSEKMFLRAYEITL